MNRQETATKSTGQIFRENICTLFNLLNLLIAIALIWVHAWSNLFFVPVIMLNIAIGIAQEIKAKKLVEKLTLLSQPKAKVERDGKEVSIPIAEVSEADILILESGNQICADAVVAGGEVEVNEALLTGESDAILKRTGDSLLSGSSVISGKCRAKVLHVGSDSYAAKLTKEAKKLKGMHSELVGSMRTVTKLTSIFIVPLGILLFLQALLFQDGGTLYSAVVGTSAGLLGMLPKGLYLLISISLAAGIISLSKKNVLVQDLYSLENLAHVDVLCLDKTGTLTQGKMEVEQAIVLVPEAKDAFEKLMGSFLAHTQDNNATFQAIRSYFASSDAFTPTHQIPFSSDRKWSAMTFEGVGTFLLGAPERLCTGTLPEEVQKGLQEGKRVLLVGLTKESVSKDQPLPELNLLAAIIIIDPIREHAADTISYFQEEGVSVKLISGDNPLTAAAAASQAGVEHADRWVDMSQVKDDEIDAAAEQYTVFGRVTPVQKKQLVEAFHRQKRTVAMTGDGVNDLLALKEADCSIAVGQGSDAARQTAQLVLLESDFSVLKDVLMEGRRVVHNVTRSAGVFFIKTVYSVLLCIICLLTNTPFPFVPIQITVIDLVIEGYPSFFLSFLPDSKRVTSRFLPEALRKAVPNAMAIVVCFLIYLVCNWCGFLGVSGENTQANALLFLLIGTVGLMGVFKMCVPMTRIKAFFAATSAIGFYAAIAVCLYLKNHILHLDILRLATPTAKTLLMFLAFVVVSILVERILSLTVCKARTKRQASKA